MAGDRMFKVAARLPLEMILNAPMHVRRLTGDAKRERNLGVFSWLDPGDASAFRMVRDHMIDAAQRGDRTMREGNGFGQPVETRRDPGGVTLREIARVPQRRPLRHGQHRVARGEAHAQGKSTRILRPAQSDENWFTRVN